MKKIEAKKIKKKSNLHKRKAVKCLETGLIYVSSSDAADILRAEGNVICPRGILAACQGRQKTERVYIGNMRNVEIIFVLLIALSMVDEILTASTTH